MIVLQLIPKKVKGIEQKLVNVETNNFDKQLRKYIEWMEAFFSTSNRL